ncbi:glycosyltransferase family 2 protein [Gephyromycinifex aptenodytis]|uniref:glycosyltransferase family 2 protein n=1 Tax=Gephyromycinifex aptenodytis TaxID=2716227 RepID=UPI001446DE0E|nr:glycosyltransferase family 2 protein [Gephyromycinifex aptenodytis]
MPNELPHVAITMCTFRRPEGLARAVAPILEQVAECDRAAVRLIIIDNDPDASAQQVVAELQAQGAELTYVHEPRPGIAAARNAGLQAAAAEDAVVFIDDDEVPAPQWLQRLIDAWLSAGCDGVTGPVEYEFSSPPDRWVRASRVFDRLSHPTGTQMPEAATNNLLLSTEILRRTGLRFDDRFGLTGGSDSALTRALVAAGADLRWCDEAVVRELVPASRAEAGWVARRTRRTTNAGTRLQILTAASGARRLRTRAEHAGRGAWRIVRGSIAGLRATHSADADLAGAAAVDVARGKGALTAALGLHDVEYRRGR